MRQEVGREFGGRRVVGQRQQRLATSGTSRHGYLAAQAVDETFEVVEAAQQLLVAAAMLLALGALGGEDALDAGAAAS